jgi:hypothetical protein
MKIKVQKAPSKKPLTTEYILAKFCYHFPQYKYHEAKKMPFQRIKQMLEVANKERTLKMIDLLQIAVAPHTQDGSGYETLLNYYKEIIDED